MAYIISEEDYLSHYGRKGMKWYQHIFGEFQNAAKYAGNKIKGHYSPDKVYGRKSNRINNRLESLNYKRGKVKKRLQKIDEEIFKINKKILKRTTGLGYLLYDANDPKTESLKKMLTYNKTQRDTFFTEVMRYTDLIDKQYNKLDKLNIKYGKDLVERKLKN